MLDFSKIYNILGINDDFTELYSIYLNKGYTLERAKNYNLATPQSNDFKISGKKCF